MRAGVHGNGHAGTRRAPRPQERVDGERGEHVTEDHQQFVGVGLLGGESQGRHRSALLLLVDDPHMIVGEAVDQLLHLVA